MGVMSIRELNANVSGALARVEGGETLDITKNGRVIAEVRPKDGPAANMEERRALAIKLWEQMDRGIPGFGGPASYEERTE